MAHTLVVAGVLHAWGDLAFEWEVHSMRFAVCLGVVCLSLTAVAQSSQSPSPAPPGEAGTQPKPADVDRDKPVQGNAWSEQAKSPPPAGGSHKKKGKPDAGHP
jgi:hypothetical protein